MKSSLRMAHYIMSITKIYRLAIIVSISIFSSCQKEVVSNPDVGNTTSVSIEKAYASPHVDAGPDKVVVYPLSTSTTLFGSGVESDNPVFKWVQTSGDPAALISDPNSRFTKVTDLKPGIYTFMLKVTDKNGVSYRDTTAISVLQKMTWNINGTIREALVHIPSGSEPAPVVFAFHGHAGTDLGFANKGFEIEWPQAIVIYPQGLPTKSHTDKEGTKSGWQHWAGEVNNHTNKKDEDLQFFDAMLSSLQKDYNINSKCIFVHGWSNGGDFVYNVLWPTRGDKLAGIASAAAVLNTTKGKVRLPVMQIAGKSDPLVYFKNQQQSMQRVCSLNQCASVSVAWAAGDEGLIGMRYWSPLHKPVVFLQYEGGHAYPADVDPLIVKFFKQVAWRINL